MEIQVLGALGEFIGGISGLVSAVAVIASLIFIGLQIRQHSKAVKSSTRSDIARNQLQLNLFLAQNPHILNAMLVVFRDGGGTDQDRALAYATLSGFFREFENQFWAYRENNFTDSVWRGYKTNIAFNVEMPHFNEFWDDRGRLFSYEFAEFIDGLASAGRTDVAS
jgi:hypothetical protein